MHNQKTELNELDFKRLEKLLSLTQSDNDNEALSAVRMANSLLKKSDFVWKDLLVNPNKHPKQNETKFYSDDDLSEMINFLFENKSSLDSWGYGFIISIKGQFKRRGKLSEKQIEIILDMFETEYTKFCDENTK